ncbi:MAG: hypothetical protein CBD26_00110 [Candidatus Pelagibacter sp. TMED166]|nr:MAG: hypothetical protein CBD26_00110 [Candidatus Pelagibacter sp. TMED166]|tara:strand:- start:1226 stop:1828 length:603 start_codon:yes stop_codon:yes gene_type:complete
MNGDIKIGKLLCDEDIITKRQLNQALQAQIKGDKRALGEILVDKGFCTLDDITGVLMDEPVHEVKKEKVAKKSKDKNEPVEISEEKVMGTKFTMSVQTIGALVMVIASGVGGYYMLLQEIQEAKELPKIDIEAIYKDEYPSRPEGHNWPRSKEQYNQQVGDLQDDMDTVFDRLDELEDDVKDLKKLVTDLRVQVANKRDK